MTFDVQTSSRFRCRISLTANRDALNVCPTHTLMIGRITLVPSSVTLTTSADVSISSVTTPSPQLMSMGMPPPSSAVDSPSYNSSANSAVQSDAVTVVTFGDA